MAGILDTWTPEQWQQAKDFMNSGQSAQGIWDTAQSVGLTPLELNKVYSQTVGNITPDVLNQQIVNNGQTVNYKDLVDQQTLGILNAPSQAAPTPASTPAPAPTQAPVPTQAAAPAPTYEPSPTAHLPVAQPNPAPTTSQIYGWNPMQSNRSQRAQSNPYAQIMQNVMPMWSGASSYSRWLSGAGGASPFSNQFGLKNFNYWNPQSSGGMFGNQGYGGSMFGSGLNTLSGMFSRWR